MSDWDDIKEVGDAVARGAGAGAGIATGFNVATTPATAALAVPLIGPLLAGGILLGGLHWAESSVL